MTELFGNPIVRFLLWVYGSLVILGPVMLRLTFRYHARVNPETVPFNALPPDARAFMEPRVPAITALGFECVGYLSLGSVARGASAYMALFSNRHTLEWADISVAVSPVTARGYIEFITRCSEDLQVDTNNNGTMPVLSPNPGGSYYVFRFPQISDASTLYRVHRALAQESTQGARPQLPPPGQEVAELKRRLERYGPRQQLHGYLYLDRAGQDYRLTWKGAILAGWRSIWPVTLLRRWGAQRQSQSLLRACGVTP
jgi:hypothetical protein